MEALDPLALLEAEYAAVLAQSRPAARGDGGAKDEQPHEDASEAARGRASASDESEEDESEEDESEGDAPSYSLLPSSPGGGGALGGFDSEEKEKEEEERRKGEGETAAGGLGGDTAKKEDGRRRDAPEMAADKRRTIMQAMQKLQLQPPAWAAAHAVSDEQLVAMVQRQLHSKQ